MIVLKSNAVLSFALVLVFCLSWTDSLAKESQPFPREVNNGAICGLLCVQEVLECYGLQVPELAKLAKRKYLGDQDGSAPSDLQLAFNDYGLASSCFTGLTPRNLLFLNKSALLRVNNVATQTQHWIVFCGASSKSYLLADIPSPPYGTSESELASIWTGTAVIIGPPWESLVRVRLGWFLLDVIPPLTGPFLVLFGLQLVARSSISIWTQLVLVSIMVFMALAVRHATSGDGFVLNSHARRNIAYRFEKSSAIPRISVIDEGFSSAMFIDSRLPMSFRAGHFPGAINLPTYATRHERDQVLLGLRKDQQLVVYCQSERCSYADTVARQLILDGFTQVVILEKGWLGLKLDYMK